MERRKFFKTSLLHLPAGLMLASFIQSCKKDSSRSIEPNGKKVIIVGAGISGLTAAKSLREKGFEVIVLEAGPQAGGRIRTSAFGSVKFDEGASWIYGDNGNSLTQVAKNANVGTVIDNEDSFSIVDSDGKAYASTVLNTTINEYKKAITDVKTAALFQSSFQTVFNSLYPGKINDKLWKYLLSSDLENLTGTDISQLNSMFFDIDDSINGNQLLVTNGFSTFIDYLLPNLNVVYNTRVTKVSFDNFGVTVLAGATEYKADYVVVSVPLSVLQKRTIEFSPALSATKIAAIDGLRMGVVNKFILQFNRTFWNNNVNYLGYTLEEKGKFNYFMNVNRTNPNSHTLVSFATGQYAVASEALTDAQAISEIMKNLRLMYGSTVPDPIRFARTKWGSMPDIFGSHSYAPAGARNTLFGTLAANISNRIFFAGEHTDTKNWGTAHAAYSSGLREASRITRLI